MIEAMLADLFKVAIMLAIVLGMCLAIIPVFAEAKKNEEEEE